MNIGLSLSFVGVMLLAGQSLLAQDNAVDAASVSAPLGAPITQSHIPQYIKYSGTLPEAPGRANVVEVRFALYANQAGGEPLWTETQQVSLDATDKYSILLGTTTPRGLPASLFVTGLARWIGVTVLGDQESVRNILVAAPYAFKAADADTVGGHLPTEFVLRDGNALIPFGIPITQINVTSPLSGGGKGPIVSIGIDTLQMARLANTNAFTSTNTFSAGIVASSPGPSINAIYATTTAPNLFSIEDYTTARNSWGIGAYASNYPVFAQAMDTVAGDETIAIYGQTFNTGSGSFGVYGQAQNGRGASGSMDLQAARVLKARKLNPSWVAPVFGLTRTSSEALEQVCSRPLTTMTPASSRVIVPPAITQFMFRMTTLPEMRDRSRCTTHMTSPFARWTATLISLVPEISQP